MKMEITSNQLRLVGKAKEIRATLRDLASRHNTVQELLAANQTQEKHLH
ncbi:Z-ring formation inhibitor MciZ [Brevibacillus fluminis]|uniref:Z-ring formation inhibitor MciZ n=1 Tax=Brevibacillus fluminis TaxID=511487 RepID=A0A3M8D0E4_9BACL|nr:Z-ring formation inhibitor MciZ [Brevibacillus fluminis]